MITTEEAKKIADKIGVATLALSDMSEEAAKRGVRVLFKTMEDRSGDYAYHHIWVDEATIDLNWLTPAEIEALAEEDG